MNLRPLLVLGFLLGAAAAALAQPAPFSETIAWSQQEMERARAELAHERERIMAEKRPKLEALTALQAVVADLRHESDTLAGRRDGSTRELEVREAALGRFNEDLGFVSSRLTRYRGTFEESLHLAERARYVPRFLALEEAAGGGAAETDDAGLTALERHVELASAALDRLGEQLGGHRSPATVVAGGVATDGISLQAGPFAFFASGDGTGAGLVRGGAGLQPVLRELGRAENRAIREVVASGSGRLPLDPTLDQALVLADARVTLWTHLRSGGLWMVPIFLFGSIALAVAVIKLFEIRRLEAPSASQIGILVDLARRNAGDEAYQAALGNLAPPVRPVFAEGYAYRKAAESTREAASHQAFISFRARLERRLPLISLTAAVSPLLGLLGTVTGMIKTFQLISVYGTGDARSFSSGISEALVTTEYGLIVAIPALLLHALLSRRTRRIVVQTAAQVDTFNKSVSPTP